MVRLRDFAKMFALWAGLISVPGLLLVFGARSRVEPVNFALLPLMLFPAVVLGLVGAAIMSFVVRPGERLGAMIVGIVVGFGLPPVAFWGLAAVLPKDESTLGYVLAGFIFAVPSGIAGIVSANWRAAEQKRT
jgi:nitrate reductase NapE component